MHASPARPTSEPAIGLVLLTPALLALLVSLAWPTLWTLWTSLQRTNLLTSGQFVGGDNYGRIVSSPLFWRSLGQSFTLALVLSAAVAVIATLLALLVHAGGREVRLAARLVLSVPLAFFAPAAGAVAWLIWLSAPGAGRSLADPAGAAVTVIDVAAASSFGIACGAALIVLLAALRGRPATAAGLGAALAGAALLVAAFLAAALQSFANSFLLTDGGPRGVTLTPMLLQFQLAFQRFDLGGGAVVASLVLLLLAALGIAAVVLAIVSGMRVELGPAEPLSGTRPAWPPGTSAVLGIVVLIVGGAVVLYGGWPRLAAAASAFGTSTAGLPLGRAFVNTVVPPVVSAFVQVLVAFIGALAIGGLRPLGNRSEWLLLPFGPWLLVGPAPLSLAGFAWERAVHLNGTFAALVPPILISVPALLVLTMCCRGQSRAAARLVAAGVPTPEAFLRAVVAPTLPMAGLLLGATALVGMQELLWPLLVEQSSDGFTLPVLMSQLFSQFAVGRSVPAVVTLMALPGVVALAVLAVAQVRYLDRLELRVGQ